MKKLYLTIIAALTLALSGCIWVDIPVPGGRECIYIIGDDYSQLLLSRQYKKYLYPISPEGIMPGSSYGEYYYFSKNDISDLRTGSVTNVKLYENKADVRNSLNACAIMKIHGVWEKVVVEGGHKMFSGNYSNMVKGEFLPPEAWQLYQSIKNMPSMEIIALLNSEKKIGNAFVRDIVLTALGEDGRLDRQNAIKLKEPLAMVRENEWLCFVVTYDKSVIDLINKYNVISPELERIDQRSSGNTNIPW